LRLRDQRKTKPASISDGKFGSETESSPDLIGSGEQVSDLALQSPDPVCSYGDHLHASKLSPGWDTSFLVPLGRNQREEEEEQEEERSRFGDVADSGDGDWLPVFCAGGERQGCCGWRRDRLNNHEGEEQQLPWRRRGRRWEEMKMLGGK